MIARLWRDDIRAVASALEKYRSGVVFGEVWKRPGLNAHDRSIATLAALVGPEPGASVAGLPLLHDPGARWTYGESTRVLGTLVEKVSGQTLDRFFRTYQR